MPNPTEKPKCPKCGRRKCVVPQGELYWCTDCRAMFDDDPDEGGDYHAEPSRRLENSERKEGKR